MTLVLTLTDPRKLALTCTLLADAGLSWRTFVLAGQYLSTHGTKPCQGHDGYQAARSLTDDRLSH